MAFLSKKKFWRKSCSVSNLSNHFFPPNIIGHQGWLPSKPKWVNGFVRNCHYCGGLRYTIAWLSFDSYFASESGFFPRKMAKKTCTPFCDNKKACPKHHDLLLTLINCSDRKNQEANACFEEYQSTVKAYLKKGWNVNDAIPDPVRNYRFPLLHWAGVMGKTRALEWMINFGR